MLKERVEEEESLATLDELEQIHTKANQMVLCEKQALTEDRDQLNSNVTRIGKLPYLQLWCYMFLPHTCRCVPV